MTRRRRRQGSGVIDRLEMANKPSCRVVNARNVKHSGVVKIALKARRMRHQNRLRRPEMRNENIGVMLSVETAQHINDAPAMISVK